MHILLLNGPNLNLLGSRRPETYGTATLPDVVRMMGGWAADLGVEGVEDLQSNHEGELIDRLHAARGSVDGIVFNPGAYTHTSYALHDAIEAIEIPTVEVHISNVEEREPWRRHSAVRPACVYTVYGRGIEGYRWGLRHLVNRTAWPVERTRYGASSEQRVDLRLPEGDGPHPAVVLVHGGFWRHQWTLDTVESIAVDLARRGVASLVVEYRRVGIAGGSGGGAASVLDVAEGIRAGLAHASVDGSRWAVVGHSAGGQLAFMALDRLRSLDGEDAVAPPGLAVSLAGVLDVEAAVRDGLGDGAASTYLGGEDPAGLSPHGRVPFGVPLLLAHGAEDAHVPLSQSEGFAAAAEAAGDQVERLRSDGGHFEFLEPDDPAWQAVADRLVAALAV